MSRRRVPFFQPTVAISADSANLGGAAIGSYRDTPVVRNVAGSGSLDPRDMRSGQAILDTLSLSATVAITSSSQFIPPSESNLTSYAAAYRNDRPSRNVVLASFLFTSASRTAFSISRRAVTRSF